MVGKGNPKLVIRSALCLPLSDTADIPPPDPPYIQDLKMSMMVGGLRSEFYEILPILDRLPTPHLHYALSVFTRLREYGKIAVRNARSASASSKATLFSKIINENAFGNLNEVEIEFMIADEASNFMIGGTDTTSTTLTYLVWAVLRHPKVRQALLAELITVPANPTACELEAAQYLNCIIDETLRLYSAVPGSLRRTTPAGGAMLAGYNIPGNTVVCTQALHFPPGSQRVPGPVLLRSRPLDQPDQRNEKQLYTVGSWLTQLCRDTSSKASDETCHSDVLSRMPRCDDRTKHDSRVDGDGRLFPSHPNFAQL